MTYKPFQQYYIKLVIRITLERQGMRATWAIREVPKLSWKSRSEGQNECALNDQTRLSKESQHQMPDAILQVRSGQQSAKQTQRCARTYAIRSFLHRHKWCSLTAGAFRLAIGTLSNFLPSCQPILLALATRRRRRRVLVT